MHTKKLRQLTGELATALAERGLPFAPNRRLTVSFLQTSGCISNLGELFPIESRLTCQQALGVCAPALELLSPTPEGGWLPYCHRYIQNLMFPHMCESAEEHETQAFQVGAQFYLTVLQFLLDRERSALPFDRHVDLQFLSPEEYADSDRAEEYRRFLSVYRQEYVYELLRLGAEITPFCTLGHTAGVHHVAMTAGRGLFRGEAGVDLALLSAAACTHDLGKFGCRPGERVPYLHYYYTDQWLLAHGLDAIAHIAANHSTWDLELDSLSAESLCLIYADFRCKQSWDAEGRETPVIFSLDEAFSVILEKLDSVDREKRRRYELVYGKLHDFEDYLRRCGVDVALTGAFIPPPPEKDPALMTPEESVRALTMLSVEHNLMIMNHLSNERKFGNIIEAARSAKNWAQLRAYLDIFGEYFSYLSVPQKTQALSFLYELLVHRDGDIRRQAAHLIGQIISCFHMGYRKEMPAHVQGDHTEEQPFLLWEQYLDQIISPDHKTTAQQRALIGYALKLVMDAMFLYSRPESTPRFVAALLGYYRAPQELGAETAFCLLDAIRYLPPQWYDENTRGDLIEFAAHFTRSEQLHLQAVALLFLREAARTLPRLHPHMRRIVEITRLTPSGDLILTFLRYQLLKRAGEDVSEYTRLLYRQDVANEVFLENLKIATHWIVKVVGVELLRDQVECGQRGHMLHISTHFSNLVKVSERAVVRRWAGQALVRIISLLSREQRNEVVVELGKGLEIGQYEISKYIPQYLGEAALYLHPTELDEQVLWLKTLLGSPNDGAVAGALNTVGVLLQHYPLYEGRFNQSVEEFERRREVLLGLLLQGLAHYRRGVRQEALLVTGKLLFETKHLSMAEKARLFSLSYRKLLFLIREGGRQEKLTFYFRAATLAHINRFISLWRLDHGPFRLPPMRRVAFFPGTFDPFTLSHKGIVRAILELGFEVYLAVDEFSWSKKSQPHLIRRQIVSISVAGEFHVHLFPDEIPVNIANPRDLQRLVSLFPGQEVYLVAGSDVVQGASAYLADPTPFSVHQMNHIIFHRVGESPLPAGQEQSITGTVIQLQLPPHLEDISSSRIRENVDQNRDISTFIDPVIQDYIYQNGLYLRDSQDKPLLYASQLEFQWLDAPETEDLRRAAAALPEGEVLCAAMEQGRDRILLLRKHSEAQVLGFVSYRLLAAAQLFGALQDAELADRIRLRSAGKVLLITGLGAVTSQTHEDYSQLLISEVLAAALKQECIYGLCLPHLGQISPGQEDLFARQGFRRLERGLALMEVDMRAPLVLIQNLETTIQEPLCRNSRVLEAVRQGHQRLQRALAGLYPGSLVLTLSADVIHQRLLQLITAYNNGPAIPLTPRTLGECMCVPFGKLMRGKTVPNTVTKTVHTDKVYSPDLSQHSIEAFPYYSPIPFQIRTIKSFGRPVILVDDLMHPGNRIRALDPILHREEVEIRVVLVGVLSGHGKDLMDARNRPVDGAYFIPSLREWFLESTLYPFIGGNTVRRDTSPVPGLLPGINHIFPYANPGFQQECSQEAMVELSRCCLESARNVIYTLEQEYRNLYARNLTLSRLSEAVILPLCPDKGTCLSYDPNLAATVYLDNDLEQLGRTYLL